MHFIRVFSIAKVSLCFYITKQSDKMIYERWKRGGMIGNDRTNKERSRFRGRYGSAVLKLQMVCEQLQIICN